MGVEKRSFPRFDFKRPAQCAYLESFPKSFDVAVVDIAPEGIGFITDQPITPGSMVYFLLPLTNTDTVKFLIKVRWVNDLPNTDQKHVGAKIYDSSEGDLDKFIRIYYKYLVPRRERKKKILLIEHDRVVAGALQAELSKKKYDVICTYDGESGFSSYVTEAPDLVIMNIVLPKLDGYSVCRKIRKLSADTKTPIVFLADKKKIAEKAAKDETGAQMCFIKPVNADHLLENVSSLMLGPADEI